MLLVERDTEDYLAESGLRGLGYRSRTVGLCPVRSYSLSSWQRWTGKRVLVYCDNLPTVLFLNKGYTSKEPAASMLRGIAREAMTHNFLMRASHIPGKLNVFADLISRQKIAEFLAMCPYANRCPVSIPLDLEHFGCS